MEVLFEPLIERYLTICGSVFIAPQYALAFNKDHEDGGSCPDFVALDFSRRQIVVVEVNGGSSVKDFAARVEARETRWFRPLLRHFEEKKFAVSNWEIRFLGFVRKANVAKLQKMFLNDDGITFFAIEDATFSHIYWDERIKGGLPASQ